MDTVLLSTARLVLQNGADPRVIALETFPFTLGRAPDRTLQLAHPHVSREHACIESDDTGFTLRDTGSRHGTFLNGKPVTTTTRLNSGDRIQLGRTGDAIVFETGEQSTAQTLISRISGGAVEPPDNELETLSLFLKAAQTLNTFSAVKDVLAAMLEYSIRLTGAERGFVFLGETFSDFRLSAAQDRNGSLILEQPAISYSIVRDAATSKSDFIVSDTARELAGVRESIVLNAIRTVIAIPLRCEHADSLLGLLYLDSHCGHDDFNSTSRAVLRTVARQGATLLENLRLLEMEREAALLRKELEVAAAIQRQIIPHSLPKLPSAHLFARTLPCTGVGGDFYDIIPLENGFIAVVADVCGKGIPAALLASTVQGMLHGQLQPPAAQPVPLHLTVQALNGFVFSHTPMEKYVTLAVLRYTQPGDGPASVELVNAGHVAPLLFRADGRVEPVDDGDLPVGLLEAVEFHSIHLTLQPGDRIALLSDGITEAENPAGEQFGLDRTHPHLFRPEPVSALFATLETFCNGARAQDDQTALVIECTQ